MRTPFQFRIAHWLWFTAWLSLLLASMLANGTFGAELRVGQQAPSFTGMGVYGGKMEFPSPVYEGKIVLIQFWASWCERCRKEVPNVREAYLDNRGDGFDVIGISLDDSGRTVVNYTEKNGMSWRQARDDDRRIVTKKYGADQIPALFLVDGDSGKILATTNELRGPGLTKVVARELAKKRRN